MQQKIMGYCTGVYIVDGCHWHSYFFFHSYFFLSLSSIFPIVYTFMRHMPPRPHSAATYRERIFKSGLQSGLNFWWSAAPLLSQNYRK